MIFKVQSKFSSGSNICKNTYICQGNAISKITAQKDKNGIQQIAGEPRYRIGDTWVRSTIDDWNGKGSCISSKKRKSHGCIEKLIKQTKEQQMEIVAT